MKFILTPPFRSAQQLSCKGGKGRARINKKSDLSAALKIYSILPKDIAVGQEGVTDQLIAPEILTVHINRRDLTVVIRRVVIDSLACITAGCVNRDFIFTLGNLAAASLLIDRTENVKELADAFLFGIARDGI